MVSVRRVPGLPSRMSARNRSVSEGKRPAVSVGVTAHCPLLRATLEALVPVSLAPESPPHPSARSAPAPPSTPSASRRPIWLAFISETETDVQAEQAQGAGIAVAEHALRA